MSIEIKGSRNYSATVIRVPELRKADNSDNLYIIDVMGITAIVDKSWQSRVGELAFLFPAEVQLSEDFTMVNDLYRDSTLNAHSNKSGYIEKNRRVRALKLRGNISNGLALPVTTTNILSARQFTEGEVFDTINGQEICRKFTVPVKETVTRAEAKKTKAFKRIDTTYLPEHYETGQWLREEGMVADDELLIITQKLHGTSVRLANTVVKRQPTKRERFAAKFLGAQIKDHDYDLVAGSKKVIKDPNNPNQAHFYKEDVWTAALDIWGHKIPKNYVVYGELVGYTPGGSPIQKGHTYGELQGKMELYVYRVAIITENGDMLDLTWDQVRKFCEQHGLKHVPELMRTYKSLFDIQIFEEHNFYEDYTSAISNFPALGGELGCDVPVPLSPGGTGKDEGVAIRVERSLIPEFFKFKNKSHYKWETDELDLGEPDLESLGSYVGSSSGV